MSNPLCECGCGQEVTRDYRGVPHRWVYGHFFRGRKQTPESIAKRAAARLAKRVQITCVICGRQFMEKPSQAKRKTCSPACFAANKRRPTQNTCVICGKTFTVYSGSRKNKTCSPPCTYEHHSRVNKASGHSPIKFRRYDQWLASLQSKENRERAAKLHQGAVRTTPLAKRHSPKHIRAVEGFVRSPSNIIYHVANITGFVANNEKLFNPEDVIWKPSKLYSSSKSCNASHGLATIMRGFRTVWKGWTVVSNREGRERMDLIGRNFQPEENQRP